MQKFYGYDDIDENDEIPDEIVFGVDDDGYGPDDRIRLDDPEELSDEEYRPKNLLGLLRQELSRPYYDRGMLSFRYNGNDYEGVPVYEINPNKFVFEFEDGDKKICKSFPISDIILI